MKGDVYCLRCGEANFPISHKPDFWINELKKIVIGLDNSIEDWDGCLMVPVLELNSSLYLCGNCYIDLEGGQEESDNIGLMQRE